MIARANEFVRTISETVAQRTVSRSGFMGMLGRAAGATAAAVAAVGIPRAVFACQCEVCSSTCETTDACQHTGSLGRAATLYDCPPGAECGGPDCTQTGTGWCCGCP